MALNNGRRFSVISPISPLEKQSDSEVCRNGDLVKIIKGPLKGSIGRLSASSIEGFYYISSEGNNQKARSNLIYQGPFFRNEFEQLN